MALANAGYNSGYYAGQAADVNYRYNTDKATNAYGRFLSQTRGERKMGDMGQAFNRTLPQWKSQWSQRGLAGPGVQSGVTNRAYSNYLGDYTRDYTRAQTDVQQELQGFDTESATLDSYRQQQLDALEQQKQDEIANAALGIEALRPYTGG